MNENRSLSELLRLSSFIVNKVCEKQFLEEATLIPLSENQFHILRILNSTSPCNISDLAKLLNVSNAATGKNIDKLVQNKLVRRRFRKMDRRTAKVSITAEGRGVIDEYNGIKALKQEEIFNKYTTKEKIEFAEHLKRFIINTLHEDADMELLCLQCDGYCGEDCVIEMKKGTCPRKHI